MSKPQAKPHPSNAVILTGAEAEAVFKQFHAQVGPDPRAMRRLLEEALRDRTIVRLR